MPKHILMCPPDYFDIEYEINPWMHQDDQPSDETAHQQWQKLHDIYLKLDWKVDLIEPIKGLPDMVFATDCGLVLDGKVFLANFHFTQRRPETLYYENWLHQQGYSQLQRSIYFLEGGDLLVFGNKILAGHGFRTNHLAHQQLENYFSREVISLKLINPNFYHLDTALAVLNENTVAYYPEVFDAASREALQRNVPNLITVDAQEAISFGLNAVSDGHTVITSDASESLLQKYRAAGLKVIGVPILEFRKAGGGIKCLTLEIGP